ncbi:hypothetical protein HDG38_001398 [Paraburkholderia sp. WSM4177]|nr:hypothetical protein [Paraburkholderia sp. WSM4177]MBB5483607.1 hypothetical protein [Paraburkholderia sp. WSM4180]
MARIVRLNVFIASTPAFRAQSTVANGASDVMAQIFAVEVEAVVALKNV